MIPRILLAIMTAVGFVSAVTFVQQPSLSESSGKATMTFTVSGPTDVEVAVLNNAGKVIRHLAAGVLGGDTLPPEPLVAGFAQSITWDGLDDYGAYSFAGPFKMRVRLGVVPQFERRIHYKDAAIIPPTAFPAWSATANNFGWGPDTVTDTSEIIAKTDPVLFTGMRGALTGVGLNDGGIKMIDLAVSDETDTIILQRAASFTGGTPTLVSLNGLTGVKRAKWGGSAGGFAFGEVVMDWFGRFFYHDRGYNPCTPDLYRFNFNGTAINYSWGTNMIDIPTYSNDGVRQNGFCAGPDGSLYQAHYPFGATVTVEPMVITKWDSVGNLIKDSLVTAMTAIQGVRVDLKGNIFVGVKIKPITDSVPRAIRGLLSGAMNEHRPYSQAAIAEEAYASIVKFGPQGGSVAYSATGDYYKVGYINTTPYPSAKNRLTVNGAQWVHFGNSFIFSKGPANDMTVCQCYNPRFDVDRFGRLIYPDPFNNCFRALDNNGNLIYRVHNRDLFPSVAVGAIVAVEATDRALYLGDHINNQIITMTWKAEAEQTLDIPTAVAEKLGPQDGALALLNYPNPIQSSTTFLVSGVRSGEHASLKIYNASGRKIVNLSSALRDGKRQIQWTGVDAMGHKVPSGLYYCTLTLGTRQIHRAVFLTK